MSPTVPAAIDIVTVQLAAVQTSSRIFVLLPHGHCDIADPRRVLQVMTSKAIPDDSQLPAVDP